MMRVRREAVFAKATGHYSRAVLEAWAPGATADWEARVEQECDDRYRRNLAVGACVGEGPESTREAIRGRSRPSTALHRDPTAQTDPLRTSKL